MRFKQYRSISILLLLALSSSVSAQPTTVGSPEVLIKQNGVNFQAPVWSPDGTTIAITGDNYRGIWLADADGSNFDQLTDADAGYGMKWSMDSESILTRLNTVENRRRNHSIAIFSKGGSLNQITGTRSSMEALPTWGQYGEKVVLIQNEKIEAFDSGLEMPQRFKTKPAQAFYVLKTNQIAKGMIPTNSTENISPFEDAVYLNLEVSPDGQKLAFEVYGGNLYVMNVDGSNLIDLGKANRPSWSPDSEYLVASVSEDDGHEITKGDIYAFSIDGNTRVNLTENTDLIAQNPNWSPMGSKIAFDVPDEGAIYVLNIQK
jgi:Tol biopolymer transport system component